MKNKIKFILLGSIAVVALLIMIVFMNRPRIDIPETSEKIIPGGIFFAEIGENSVLSREKLKSLRDKFGNNVIESWSPLKINDFPESFYKKFFPDFLEYSTALESREIKEKSGKNSIKIKYPYVEKNSDLYNEIDLTFSGFQKKPMIFRIKGKKISEITENLNKRFSSPETVSLNNKKYNIWKKENSILISTIEKDRFETPYIQITIFYISNLKTFFSKITS